MNLLAIDTATEACSVALATEEGTFRRHVEEPRAHGDRLLDLIEEVLDEAGLARDRLDAVAFGRGPGGFTSLRIGIGVVQGIAYALDLPVVPVSTLASLAQGACRLHGAERAIAAIDARMGEIYCGTFELDAHGVMQAAAPERVLPPERLEPPQGSGWQGCGTGWRSYRELLAARCGDALAGVPGPELPHAIDLLTLARAGWQRGEAVSADQAVPVYLRDRVAEKKARPEPGSRA